MPIFTTTKATFSFLVLHPTPIKLGGDLNSSLERPSNPLATGHKVRFRRPYQCPVWRPTQVQCIQGGRDRDLSAHFAHDPSVAISPLADPPMPRECSFFNTLILSGYMRLHKATGMPVLTPTVQPRPRSEATSLVTSARSMPTRNPCAALSSAARGSTDKALLARDILSNT